MRRTAPRERLGIAPAGRRGPPRVSACGTAAAASREAGMHTARSAAAVRFFGPSSSAARFAACHHTQRAAQPPTPPAAPQCARRRVNATARENPTKTSHLRNAHCPLSARCLDCPRVAPRVHTSVVPPVRSCPPHCRSLADAPRTGRECSLGHDDTSKIFAMGESLRAPMTSQTNQPRSLTTAARLPV